MKKEYQKPSMEAVEMKNGQQLLAGSVTSVSSGGIFDGTVSGGTGNARSPEFDEMEELIFGN